MKSHTPSSHNCRIGIRLKSAVKIEDQSEKNDYQTIIKYLKNPKFNPFFTKLQNLSLQKKKKSKEKYIYKLVPLFSAIMQAHRTFKSECIFSNKDFQASPARNSFVNLEWSLGIGMFT